MTYARLCAQNAKLLNFFAPFYGSSRIVHRHRSDKAAEDIEFDQNEEIDMEEEISRIRNVSNLPPWQYNKYKGRMNDLNEGENEYVRSRKFLRKMYARYGAESGINPSVMWPSKPELQELIKDEQEWEPTFQQLVKRAQENKQAEEEERDKR